MNKPLTKGAHHVGLTVSKLEESADFFINVLGWSEVRRKEDYPAIFVSDGSVMLTLWEAKDSSPIEFDRKKNIGLHHLALAVNSSSDLDLINTKLQELGAQIEFSPEFLGVGPAKHMMCLDPSGIRIEFTWPGK